MNSIIEFLNDFSLPLTIIVTLVSMLSTMTTVFISKKRKKDIIVELEELSEEEICIKNARAYIESLSDEELQRFIHLIEEREIEFEKNEKKNEEK